MRYGFKADAERRSGQARELLSLGSRAPIDAWAYCSALGIVVLPFDKLPLAESHCNQLLREDSESWSGLTLKEGDRHFVVVNPTHGVGRQANTLVHEIAHIQLNHVAGRVDISDSGIMLLSDYPDDQEQEADWLAGAILIPREALLFYRSLGWSEGQISEHFGTSLALAQWRLRMTGIDAQLRRSAKFK